MTQFLTICLLLICPSLIAQERTFVKEYSYRASEIDSKVSSRAIAINQLRSQLLNEVGVYVQSESLLKTSEVSSKFSQDFVENISTISAGIVRLVVLDETWNGETFWMKASITVDKKNLEESLRQLVNDQQKVKELEEAKAELKDAQNKLKSLNLELLKVKNENQKLAVAKRYDAEIEEIEIVDLVLNGKAKLHAGAYDQAITDFNKVLRIRPKSADLFALRSDAWHHLNDETRALGDINAALNLDQSKWYYYFLRGSVTDKMSQFGEAILDYSKSIKLIESDSDVFQREEQIADISWLRGIAKYSLNDFKGAISDFDKTLANDPKNQSAYFIRANAKMGLSNFQGAIEDFNKAINLNSKDATTYYFRGLAKSTLGDKSGACLDFKKANELGEIRSSVEMKKTCN